MLKYENIDIETIEASTIEGIKENIYWLVSQVEGIQFSDTHRNKIAAALFSIALDQGSGIILLIENSKFSPACSLLRVAFESLVRGKWIQMAANDKFIEDIDQREFPNLYPQIKQIRCKDSDIGKTILNFKNRTDDMLHDFTHIGQRAIARQISGSKIKPNYEKAEILETLSLARSYCFIAATSLCDLADNEEVSRKIYFRFKSLLPLIEIK